MCEHCTPLAKNTFPSEQDFISFEKVLEAKSIDGTFIRVIDTDELEHNTRKSTYQCTFCGTDWVLSVPENFNRGYFLPNEESVELRENNINNKTHHAFKTFQGKSKNNCGCCLGMIFLVIALILYLLYNFSSFIIDLIV